LDTQFAGQTSVNVTAIQEAIWDLLGANPQFATTKTVGGVTTNTLVGSWIKTAATDYSGLSQSFLSGYSVVIPVTVAKDGSVAEVSTTYPQWFLVATPEPGAIYMVLGGIGLIGMGRIVRRKRSA
jgi:hypothetical protein